ncbi:MAG: DUF2071 domain-containing protein [Lewinellaceae bacterium]|nr:DUF2071 domain-containing protein [Lewinellaceae bacterium]
MPSPFLTAQWRRLVLFNYAIDPDALLPYLPAHTEPDEWNGTCYVSLVGFMFLDTRLKGVAIPWHRNFEEINLRFYVQRRDPVTEEKKRGVVFIREIVPKRAIALVANALYRERYRMHPMWHLWQEKDGEMTVEYAWKQTGCWQSFGVRADMAATDLKEGSEAEFITEHYWGYARRDARYSVEYQVEHPRWQVYPIKAWHCEVDFGAVYGPAFGALNGAEPRSIFLAEGSEVAVLDRRIISA